MVSSNQLQNTPGKTSGSYSPKDGPHGGAFTAQWAAATTAAWQLRQRLGTPGELRTEGVTTASGEGSWETGSWEVGDSMSNMASLSKFIVSYCFIYSFLELFHCWVGEDGLEEMVMKIGYQYLFRHIHRLHQNGFRLQEILRIVTTAADGSTPPGAAHKTGNSEDRKTIPF